MSNEITHCGKVCYNVDLMQNLLTAVLSQLLQRKGH